MSEFGVCSACVRREFGGVFCSKRIERRSLSAAYGLAPPGASDDGVGNGVERRVFQDIHR